MTIVQVLSQARDRLKNQSISDAALESEVLLRHALKIDRVALYLEMRQELTAREETIFQRLVERRLNGEPLAYITGEREFFGLDYYVNHNVLIPRPETEIMVARALALAENSKIETIADIGTGCGEIAITLALKLDRVRVYATDISVRALEVAVANARRHGVLHKTQFLNGDLLAALPEACDLIAANLPYVKETEITGSIEAEPRLALDGGRDGLKLIKRLCLTAHSRLKNQGHLLLEIGRGQGAEVKKHLEMLYPSAKIEIIPDLAGIDRVVSLALPAR